MSKLYCVIILCAALGILGITVIIRDSRYYFPKKTQQVSAAILAPSIPATTLIEIPLTIGAIGAMLLPALAAVGAIAALVTKCTIVVVKK